jgi:hypothetical protein
MFYGCPIIMTLSNFSQDSENGHFSDRRSLFWSFFGALLIVFRGFFVGVFLLPWKRGHVRLGNSITRQGNSLSFPVKTSDPTIEGKHYFTKLFNGWFF